MSSALRYSLFNQHHVLCVARVQARIPPRACTQCTHTRQHTCAHTHTISHINSHTHTRKRTSIDTSSPIHPHLPQPTQNSHPLSPPRRPACNHCRHPPSYESHLPQERWLLSTPFPFHHSTSPHDRNKNRGVIHPRPPCQPRGVSQQYQGERVVGLAGRIARRGFKTGGEGPRGQGWVRASPASCAEVGCKA